MTATVSAMDMVKARRERGWAAGTVDEEAVAAFLIGTEDASREQLITVVKKLHHMIETGQTTTGPNGKVSLETIATVADRLSAIIAST